MRFSEHLKIAIFRRFLREIPSLQRNKPSVVIKRPVVRAILRDIFRIISHVIYFSSHAILKTSDEILKTSDEIGGKSPKFEMNEPKKTKWKRKKCVLIFQNEEKTCDFCRSALTFRLRDLILFNLVLLALQCSSLSRR